MSASIPRPNLRQMRETFAALTNQLNIDLDRNRVVSVYSRCGIHKFNSHLNVRWRFAAVFPTVAFQRMLWVDVFVSHRFSFTHQVADFYPLTRDEDSHIPDFHEATIPIHHSDEQAEISAPLDINRWYGIPNDESSLPAMLTQLAKQRHKGEQGRNSGNPSAGSPNPVAQAMRVCIPAPIPIDDEREIGRSQESECAQNGAPRNDDQFTAAIPKHALIDSTLFNEIARAA